LGRAHEKHIFWLLSPLPFLGKGGKRGDGVKMTDRPHRGD
jgi:hypothetical protein